MLVLSGGVNQNTTGFEDNGKSATYRKLARSSGPCRGRVWAYVKPVDPFSDPQVCSHTVNGHRALNGTASARACPKRGPVNGQTALRILACQWRGRRRARNLDTQQQALEAVGIRPELIYPDVASGGSLTAMVGVTW